jgi:hypothetical protein
VSFVPTRVPAPGRRLGTVAVTIDGVCRRGRALDLRGDGLSPATLVAAVRAASTPGATVSPRPRVHVDCEPGGVVHAHVCRIPSETFDLRDALAAAARSHDVVAPTVSRLERARAELQEAAYEPTEVDPSRAKRRVADTERTERRLNERVAALRGRLDALREVGADTADVEAELAETVGTLTEVETDRIAAEQRLVQLERVARAARDRRQRRLRLADHLDNCRRQVRRELVASVYDEFAAAVEALPGDADPGTEPSEYAGDRTTAALAVACLARLDAPVVLAADRFGSPAEAATRLDAPVLRL